jgi:hypothetical protein
MICTCGHERQMHQWGKECLYLLRSGHYCTCMAYRERDEIDNESEEIAP